MDQLAFKMIYIYIWAYCVYHSCRISYYLCILFHNSKLTITIFHIIFGTNLYTHCVKHMALIWDKNVVIYLQEQQKWWHRLWAPLPFLICIVIGETTAQKWKLQWMTAGCHWAGIFVQGPILLTIFACNSNSMETAPCCNSVAGHQIATNFFAHATTAMNKIL